MSFARLVYYSAIVGGWAALLGWAMVELLFYRSGGPASAGGRLAIETATGAVIGASICAALESLAAANSGGLARGILRVPMALLLGAIVGALGAGLGGVCVWMASSLAGGDSALVAIARIAGWIVAGAGIGAVGGLCDRAAKKLKHGLIGGALGGFVGGVLFVPVAWTQRHLELGSDMSARVAGFVCLGLAIGLLVGLAHVVLKDAWLTVEDGYRTGRQLVLSQPVTALGRGDHLPLAFLGPSNRDLEAEHCRIVLRADGTYALEDGGSRLGTRLNGQAVRTATPLKDGDVIKLGGNHVRFRERRRQRGAAPRVAAAQPAAPVAPPLPRSAPAPKPAGVPSRAGGNAAPPISPTAPASPPTRSSSTPASIRPASPRPAASPPANAGGGIKPPPPPPKPKPKS